MKTKPLYRSQRASFDKNIYLPVGNLVAAPVVSSFAGRDFFASVASDMPPQRFFLILDNNLNVLTTEKEKIGSLRDCLKVLERSVPVFCIKDEKTADLLAEFTDENNVADASVCVEYEDRNVLEYAYKLMPLFKGMIDYRKEKLPKNPADLAGALVSHSATSVILKGEDAEKENVKKLQRRFIQVMSEDSHGVHEVIYSGVNGVVTNNPEAFYTAYQALPENTIAKNINLYAHKGFQNNGMYSENTISGISAAGKYGFDGAEIDVKLTSDDVPVVMHNITTKGVFHGEELNVEKSTFDKLKNLKRVGYEHEGIDSFSDLAEKMSEYPETPLVIELKPLESNYNLEEMVRQVKHILAQENSQKNCTLIMGKLQPDLSYVRAKLKNIPAAQCDCERNPTLPQTREQAENIIYKIINITKGNSCGYNPEDTMVNRLLAEYAKIRGITLFPWSRSWFFAPSKWEENGEKCDELFISGYDGWTTDHGEMYLDYPIDLYVDSRLQEIKAGETVYISGKNKYRDGSVKDAENTRVMILKGEAEITDKGEICPKNKGETEGILIQKHDLHFGKSFHIISNTFKIKVQ